MAEFINFLFQDMILLLATLVFVATFVILLWTIKTLKTPTVPSYENLLSVNDQENIEKNEQPGLIEAQLQEIFSRLSVISRELTEIKKSVVNPKRTAESTIPVIPAASELEKSIKRIELILSQPVKSTGGGPSQDHVRAQIPGAHGEI